MTSSVSSAGCPYPKRSMMATFPYNPTRIISPPNVDDFIYIFQPPTPNSDSSQLLALNTTNPLNTTSLPYVIVSPTLPFLFGTEEGVSYVPAINDGGDILVYAGKCEDAAQGSAFWRLMHTVEGLNSNKPWIKTNLSSSGTSSSTTLDGANYLASAITFSSTLNATSEIYIFGGMCPNSSSSTVENWTQTANYSNSMLTIQPPQSSSLSSDDYVLSTSSSKGPPIAEAGFSITPLQPSYFNSGYGNTTGSRNQNYILLGGHTQQAFINMSQLALYSLPEKSWAFLAVDIPSTASNADIANGDKTTIDSRSGHTALLTSDGQRIIVFGGWVGDTKTAAKPQLAVLELGVGYGGSGDWQWKMPSPTGPGLADGAGIYGHGATMLSGDVMMVVGGYQIPASNGAKRKRASPSISTSVYFLNTTSSSWITDYTHPGVCTSRGPPTKTASTANSTAKRAGLGAGLTFGILAIMLAVFVGLWYGRRLKRRRDAREEELRNIAAGAHRIHLSGPGSRHQTSEMAIIDGEEQGVDATTVINRVYPLSRSGRVSPEAERTGLLFEIPSPTRGLRRSLHSRGAYQPAPRYDDGRRAPGFSTIHPIDERDEYDEKDPNKPSSDQSQTIQREDLNILSNVPVLDPFHDPIDGSRTPSPQSPQDRELEVRNWVNDWSAADAMMHHGVGRVSPEKTDRTSSTLSDQSARSGFSSQSIQRSVGSISRSISQRSAAIFTSVPFRSTNDTTVSDDQHIQHPSQRYSPQHRRSRSLTLAPNSQRTLTSDTFTTAATSFPQSQSEGEALLGDYVNSGEDSPARSQSRARGWMGSVRRALTGTDRSASTSPGNGNSHSPTKNQYAEGGIPRRAASTGAMLWQRRQGARDWDEEGGIRRGARSEVNGQDDDDEEWDVESAVERRVVQVMFTVPKEKLRVVNRGPDGDGESMLSAEAKETGEGGEGHIEGKGKEKECK